MCKGVTVYKVIEKKRFSCARQPCDDQDTSAPRELVFQVTSSFCETFMDKNVTASVVWTRWCRARPVIEIIHCRRYLTGSRLGANSRFIARSPATDNSHWFSTQKLLLTTIFTESLRLEASMWKRAVPNENLQLMQLGLRPVTWCTFLASY